MEPKRVSVIIPVYNGALYLREAIESALAQTHAPLEVIVLDDGSTDATPEIARSLPVTYIRQENRGVSAARNAAIERAGGDYFALLDSDDIWLPDKLSTQLVLLEGTHNVYATCHLLYFTEPGQGTPDWFPLRVGQEDAIGLIVPSCWLIPRPVWDRVGPFREDMRVSEDVDWLTRAKDLGISTVMAPELLVRRRLHDNNLTAQAMSAGRLWLDVLRQSLTRRRANE